MTQTNERLRIHCNLLYFYKFPLTSVSLLHVPKVQITLVWHVKWCGLLG